MAIVICSAELKGSHLRRKSGKLNEIWDRAEKSKYGICLSINGIPKPCAPLRTKSAPICISPVWVAFISHAGE